MVSLDKFYDGNVRALSQLISAIEYQQNGVHKTLGEIFPKAAGSLKIGITGPPGAGKSTLVNSLAHQFIDSGSKVGILAVDPTSPFTGGALLGDRVRMNEFPIDGRVYFRSMATRGSSGGLSAATDNATLALGAFGYDIILIETVGVGQVELDIIDSCDAVIVVLVPESGDSVQTMKAGLMEIGDVFVVNKCDRPGSDRMAADLRYAIDSWKRQDEGWKAPVVCTEAINGKNLDQLFETVQTFVKYSKDSGRFVSQRRQQISKKIMSLLQSRFRQEFLDQIDSGEKIESYLDDIVSGKSDPFAAGEKLYQQFRP
ncbi:MAG: methylmalonyl Co-A mutase-associated GTPase MeaB [candidate division Zixibacteria bacterium]|nr:methylmalonyl Co-A mutase-associated GTPase MeaB [candidate division Zixibacteria bacterium]